MSHNSYVRIGSATFFWCRDGYDPELAALFTEADRHYELIPAADEDTEDSVVYDYRVTARQMRQRLKARAFTVGRAWSDLELAVKKWAEDPDGDRSPQDVGTEFERYVRILEGRETFADHEEPRALLLLDPRILLCLLLDRVPDETLVALELAELTGCCVELDPHQPIAEPSRKEQLRRVAVDAPLIVLTEGSADSRLLSMGMEITHPHLIGFINFIDFIGVPAEGSAGTLAKTLYSFVAAGIANRIVAIADNDTAAHEALSKIKEDKKIPDSYRILHYPDLPLLKSYPTLGPYASEAVLTDVNGRAGALEMYLGHDALTLDEELAPIQWTNYSPKLQRYQGALLPRDKTGVQKAFEDKVAAAHRGADPAAGDWSGIHAIIEHILDAFD
jgi:hypothetical protein